MRIERFEITSEHLKLLKRMWVSWNDCEYGAPSIDCKKPYGNGDVEGDIAEILDWEVNEYGELTDKDTEEARKIHEDMKIVLQICLSTLSFNPGMYEKEGYGNDWKLITKN